MNLSQHIVFEDPYLLVIHKPAGLNSDRDKFNHPSVEGWAAEYVGLHKPLFLFHRIDRPSSGLVMLVKKKTALVALQNRQEEISKIYKALVEQPLENKEGTLEHFVYKNLMEKKLEVYDRPIEGKTKHAALAYTTLRTEKNFTELEIRLKTGRYHQIRAQLGHLKHPLLGDRLYGSTVDFGEVRIGLHAWKLDFNHPVDGKRLQLEAPLPAYWPQ